MKKLICIALTSLPLMITGCAHQPGAGADEGEEMIESTVVLRDASGKQTVEVTQMTKRDQQKLVESRRHALELAAEGVGETSDRLTLAQNDPYCQATGLWVFSQPNMSGNMICYRDVGHEGSGWAGAYIPPSWSVAQGGANHPMSFWPGEEKVWFFSYLYNTAEVYNAWSPVYNADGLVQNTDFVDLFRFVTAPVSDASLTAPAGNYPLSKYAATGSQIYVCQADPASPGNYIWTFSAPSAVLTDPHKPGDVVGWHYVGPMWQSSDDGSTVKGQVQVKVPNPGSIPQLLLKATANTGWGTFANVTYIQRLNTTGGAAPGSGCDAAHLNQLSFVNYTADYYFYVNYVPS